ncbi:MAG: hypothetical protein KC503_06560 [Myxococcales bacterium]|nr:hypothetical protein [Myxococcales bacterium]
MKRCAARALLLAAAAAAAAAATSGCGGDSGQLEARWTIGGLQPADTRADPWVGIEASLDSCAEVGAASIDIRTLSGPSSISARVACSTSVVGSDGGRVALQRHLFGGVALGQYELAAFLVDENGERLTREITIETEVTVRQGLARFDFAHDVFRDPSDRPIVMNGTYRFRATYVGGQSCDDMQTPVPQLQYVRLLDAANQVVSAQVCAGRQCTDTTRKVALACVPADQTQTIAELPWGKYRLELWAESARTTNCWAVDVDIVVGAGENPTAVHDIAEVGCP